MLIKLSLYHQACKIILTAKIVNQEYLNYSIHIQVYSKYRNCLILAILRKKINRNYFENNIVNICVR